jgi:hypothetical protein
MTRRDFFRFFLIGGVVAFLGKKIKIKSKSKKARFWRKLES